MLLNKRISIIDFVKIIKVDLIILTLYAVIVGIADNFDILNTVTVPLAITLSLGTSLSLLLAFRTAQSYDRWWEARQIWGSIVNDSRTLTRQLQSFATGAEGEQLVRQVVERQIVWCYAMGDYLRRKDYANNVETYFKTHAIGSEQAPNMLLSKHSDDISETAEKGLINPFQQIQLDSTIMRLCDSLGKCERIKNTVFPRSYSLLIHLIIYIFATLLPFGIPDQSLLVEILLTFIIPVIFICIERTAILMQDPFENRPLDIPMTALAQTIEANLRRMLGDKHEPLQKDSDSYYVL